MSQTYIHAHKECNHHDITPLVQRVTFPSIPYAVSLPSHVEGSLHASRDSELGWRPKAGVGWNEQARLKIIVR